MLKKHVVARLQRVAKIHIILCLHKNGNGFLVTIFLACCLTNCALVVYAVFFLLVVARPVFVNSVPSMLFGE